MFFFTAILVHPKVQPDGMMYGPMVWSNDVWRLPELQWVFVTATVSEAGSHGKPLQDQIYPDSDDLPVLPIKIWSQVLTNQLRSCAAARFGCN